MAGKKKTPMPEFVTKPKRKTSSIKPAWAWTPTGDHYDFQLANNEEFTDPIIDQTRLYDLSYELGIPFAADGSSDRRYFYRVRAHAAEGSSEWAVGSFELITSRAILEEAKPPKFLSAPEQRTADNTPTFQWERFNIPGNYQLQICKEPTFQKNVVDETLENNHYIYEQGFSDSGGQDGIYYYRLRFKSKDLDTEWEFNPEKNFFELVTRPLPPAFTIRPEPRSNNSRPMFGWDATVAKGAAKFMLEISTDPHFKAIALTHESADAKEDGLTLEEPLEAGGLYFFRICAIDAKGKRSVWASNAESDRFIFDPLMPNAPIIDIPPVTSYIPMEINGIKPQNTSVVLNGETIVYLSEDVLWSAKIELLLGVNILSFHCEDARGNVSNPILRTCTYNPPMRIYDFYTRDALSDDGVEPGKALYGSAPDTFVFGPLKMIKIDPEGEDEPYNFDSLKDYEVYTHLVKGSIRDYLKDPKMLAGNPYICRGGKNLIYVRAQNKGFSSGLCRFRVFYAPFSSWPKVSQWVELTPEYDDGERMTHWHRFPEMIPGGNSGAIVSDPIVVDGDDPRFGAIGDRGCIITVIQAEHFLDDPSFLKDRSPNDPVLTSVLDSYPEIFRQATYQSNNVTYKNISVVSAISSKYPGKNPSGRGYDETFVPAEVPEEPYEDEVKFEPGRLFCEHVRINGPGRKIREASILVDISNFETKGRVFIKVPRALLPVNRKFKYNGANLVKDPSEVHESEREALFSDHGFVVFQVNNDYNAEIGNLDLALSGIYDVYLVFSLSEGAKHYAQYTLSVIQLFNADEVGRVMFVAKTRPAYQYPYVVSSAQKVLHRRGCKDISKHESKSLLPCSSVSEAALSGYVRCRRCMGKK